MIKIFQNILFFRNYYQKTTFSTFSIACAFVLVACGPPPEDNTCENGVDDPNESCFEAPFFVESPAALLDGVLVDLNRDTVPDLAASAEDGTVIIFQGDPGGGLIAPDPEKAIFSTGANPARTALARRIQNGDIDNNGTEDLVVALFEIDANGQLFGEISTLLGNGDSTFQEARISELENAPVDMELADFNDDGILDIITFSANIIEVRTGDGGGVFANPQAVEVISANPTSFALGTLNDDEFDDLLIVDAAQGVSRLFSSQQGSAFFDGGAIANFPAGNAIVLDEVSGDNRVDLLVGESDQGAVSIGRGLGNGEFETPLSFIVGDIPNTIKVSDLDQNGNLDLISTGGATFALLEGQGAGVFVEGGVFWGGSSLFDALFTDLNQDRIDDLLFLGGAGVSIVDGFAGDFPKDLASLLVGQNPKDALVGDIQKNNLEDLVVLTKTGISILENEGDANFAVRQELLIEPAPIDLALLDIDGDTDLDIVSLDETRESGLLILNENGTFALDIENIVTFPADTNALLAVDVNDDKLFDLLALGNDPSLLQSDGQALGAAVSLNLGPSEAAAFEDLDQDGILDLAIAQNTDLQILAGPDFTLAQTLSFDGKISSVALVDFDGDTQIDIALTDQDTEELILQRNEGGLIFSEKIPFKLVGANGIGIADTDGDNISEVIGIGKNKSIVVQFNENESTILQTLPIGGFLGNLPVGDLDQNDTLDLIFALDNAGLILSRQAR